MILRAIVPKYGLGDILKAETHSQPSILAKATIFTSQPESPRVIGIVPDMKQLLGYADTREPYAAVNCNGVSLVVQHIHGEFEHILMQLTTNILGITIVSFYS